jgi:GMP synthase (glutamine-hydrolysing)
MNPVRRRSTPGIVELGIPVLGICYGFQVLAQQLGGGVANTGLREYGATETRATGGVLFADQPAEQTCWMSHGDRVETAPPGFTVTASTDATPVAAFENTETRMFGVQWHPEVVHSDFGQRVLENFLWNGAGIAPDWTSGNVIDEQVTKIRAQVGEDLVICGLVGRRRFSGRRSARAQSRRRTIDLRLR